MPYRVVIPKTVQKELARLDKRYLGRILYTLKALGANPYIGKKLLGEHAGEYSYRVYPYRIIYKIIKDQLVVLVVAVGHRQSIYRK